MRILNIRDKIYHGYPAASKALLMSEQSIRRRIKSEAYPEFRIDSSNIYTDKENAKTQNRTNSIPVIIDGIEYPSMQKAKETLGISDTDIKNILDPTRKPQKPIKSTKPERRRPDPIQPLSELKPDTPPSDDIMAGYKQQYPTPKLTYNTHHAKLKKFINRDILHVMPVTIDNVTYESKKQAMLELNTTRWFIDKKIAAEASDITAEMEVLHTELQELYEDKQYRQRAFPRLWRSREPIHINTTTCDKIEMISVGFI